MSDDALIKVEGVSKKFCRSLKKSLWYGMQDLGNQLRGRRHGADGGLRPDQLVEHAETSVSSSSGVAAFGGHKRKRIHQWKI